MADLVKTVRGPVEGTDLTRRAIASFETQGAPAPQDGGPSAPGQRAPSTALCPVPLPRFAGEGQPQPPRPARLPLTGQRGGGHPIVPEVVERAGALVEDTTLSLGAIAKRIGVGKSTLARWQRRHGWQRPAGAPGSLPPPRADGRARPVRSRVRRGKPYMTDAVEEARALLTGTLLSQKNIARQIGVSQWWVGDLLRRRGWERPAVPARSKRFAASKRTGVLAAEGDRRGRPYAREVRREACNLYELTRIGTALIGARLGVHPGTVARWAREERWDRPHGPANANQLRGLFGSGKWRG